MATGFPQFEESQPVINTVKINDESSGHEAFAKVLGALSETAQQEIPKMLSEESESMYVNSVANIKQLQTGAQIRMLQDPDQAVKISQQTNDIIDEVQQNTRVNSRDRSRLNSYVSGAKDEIDLHAAKTEVTQRQLMAADTHWSNWTSQLQVYENLARTDHEKAEKFKEAMIGSLHSLVKIRAITPIQAAGCVRNMTEVVGKADRFHRMYGNPETTAEEYHTEMSHPLNHDEDMMSAPVNATTGWLIDYHNNDLSFQSAQADVANRMKPNPENFNSLPKHQQNQLYYQMRGVQEADGMINSGRSFPEIQREVKRLSEKGKVLNEREQAKKGALENYVDEYVNGNSLEAAAKTPIGRSIMRSFTDRNTAIQNSYVYSPEGKATALAKNKDKMVDSMRAYYEGIHAPIKYAQPIPLSDVTNVQNAFVAGQDPSTVMQIMNQYSQGNQLYVANAMKNPDQRMIVQSIGLVGNKFRDINDQYKLDFIAANQSGTASEGATEKGIVSLQKDIKNAPTDKTLMTAIYSNLKKPLNYVSQTYDQNQSIMLQNSMLTTTLNMAKRLAQKNGDLGMIHYQKYIDEASKFYQKSYDQQTGSNWIVNKNQSFQSLTNHQCDELAAFAIRNGNDYIKSHLGESRYNQMLGRGSLKMIVTPTGYLQAVNANGDIAYSVAYTTNLIPHAINENKKARLKEEAELKAINLSAYEQIAKTQLNVR